MASYSATAFNDVNAFSVTAFDFDAAPSFNPAFSDGAFGRNTAFWDQAFSFGALPPPTPTRPSQKAMGGYSPNREDERRRRIKRQNEDDLRIVMLLTEFLSRTQ